MTQELISVVGPTASGKTALAVEILKKWRQQGHKGILISLDSKQIYQELPILSGADLSSYQDFLQSEVVFLQIYNLADKRITDDWSLGQMLNLTQNLLKQAVQEQKKVILVGGTLLYHQKILNNNAWTQIPPNDNVRFAAENMNVSQLQNWLQELDPEGLIKLNESDRLNSRRLVRKIELNLHQKIFGLQNDLNVETATQLSDFKQQFVQPNYNLVDLPIKIKVRVDERFQNGALEEVQNIRAKYSQLVTQKSWISKMPLGFKEILDFLENKIDKDTCLRLWNLHECQYAKRQMTFLKKLLDYDTNLIDKRELLTN